MNPSRIIFLLFSFSAFFFTSCNEDLKKTPPHAHIAGEIVNPTNGYVTLLKNNEAIDTLYLDQSNRFKFQLKNIDAGLYTLKHEANAQMLHIAPGDSILLRANTLEFDESLHFSGEGGGKNNFLINTFLKDEANTELIFSYYDIPPKEFAKKTDSIKTARLGTLKKWSEKYHFSNNFLEMAKKSIFYEAYDLRERYTYMVNTNQTDFALKFPKDFHAYRNEVDFNEEILQTSPGYIRFIEDYLINKTIADCLEKEADNNDCTIYSSRNFIKRIKLLDKLTQLPVLKKHLLYDMGAMAMTVAKTWEETRTILEVLKEKNLPEEGVQKLKRLALIQTAFMPGIIPRDLPFISSSGQKLNIQDIISEPTIFYIWSLHAPSRHEKEHKIIQEYAIKYPEINFLGVNIDIGETEAWKNTLKKYGYDPEKEFQLGNITIEGKSIAQDLHEYYMNKLVFVNAEGQVIIGNAYLPSPAFESIILSFLNS